MKILPLFIAHKFDHIINFDQSFDIKSKITHQSSFSYIITNLGSEIKLIKFYANHGASNTMDFLRSELGEPVKKAETKQPGYKLQATDGCKSVFIKSLDCIQVEGNHKDDSTFWSLNITLTNDRTCSTPVALGGEFSMNNDTLCYCPRNGNNIVNFNISFKLEWDGYLLENKSLLNLFLAPPSNIHPCILDFGSEASQMLLKTDSNKINEVSNQDRVDLFANMKSLYSETGNDIDYIQFSGRHDQLFRSKFFVARNLRINDSPSGCADPLLSFSYTNPVYKPIVARTDLASASFQSDYIQLPNPKISSFGDAKLPKFMVSFNGGPVLPKEHKHLYESVFHRMSIIAFINTALEIINGLPDSLESGPRYLDITILVPNVYSHVRISHLLYNLYQDLEPIVNGFQNIGGLQLSAMAESDASFIGCINRKVGREQFLRDDNYLIMDSGKGTLDFSIVRKRDKSEEYVNIFRSGIIGSGNAITYAFLVSLIETFVKVKGLTYTAELKGAVKQFIYDKFFSSSADIAEINNAMDAVEKYKARSSETKDDFTSASAPSGTALSSCDLPTFTRWVNSYQGKIDLKYVDSTVDTICNNAVQQIRDGFSHDENDAPAQVLFTGRGFLYKPFREKMYSALSEEKLFPGIKVMTCVASETEMKTVCLFPFNAKAYDSRIVGTPTVVNKPDDLNKISEDDPKPKKKTLIRNRRAGSIIHLEPSETVRASMDRESERKSLVDGFCIDEIESGKKKINIGGMLFGIKDCYTSFNHSAVFFDGSDFVIRGDNTEYMLDLAVGTGGEDCFASIFPDCAVSSAEEIPYPNDTAIINEVSAETDDNQKHKIIKNLISRISGAFKEKPKMDDDLDERIRKIIEK